MRLDHEVWGKARDNFPRDPAVTWQNSGLEKGQAVEM